jgi:hypothetical protein
MRLENASLRCDASNSVRRKAFELLKSLPVICGFDRLFSPISLLEDNLVRACDQSVFRLSSNTPFTAPVGVQEQFLSRIIGSSRSCRDARSPKAAAFL